MVSTKICTKCMEELPATMEYFYFSKKCKDGFNPWCKFCFREYKREHRQQVAKNRKEWKFKNKEKHNFLTNLHQKIRRIKSKQKYCSICNQEKKLELASINGVYSEDPNDYWWLCHACHHLYDRTNKTHKRIEVKN